MKSNLLDIETSLLLIIDIQEKILKVQFEQERIVKKASILAKTAKILDIPVIVSEQYPQGLGPTVKEIKDEIPHNAVTFEKKCFSCCLEPGFNGLLDGFNRKQILVCGMESHICVHQTVCGLVSQGYEVYLIQDAITSRKEEEYKQGLTRMAEYGAVPSNVEMALFELIKSTRHPQFKAIQGLIK